MNKIRKLIAWIWFHKERMVLIVVVGFLCQRVWQVFKPPPPPEEKSHPSPKAGGIPLEITPPVAPGRPVAEFSGDYSDLYDKNPFWLHAKPVEKTTDSGEVTTENLGIELLQIRVVGSNGRAQLKTGVGIRKWYTEGEQFQDFQLVKVDQATNSVVLFSDQLGRDFTLTKE